MRVDPLPRMVSPALSPTQVPQEQKRDLGNVEGRNRDTRRIHCSKRLKDLFPTWRYCPRQRYCPRKMRVLLSAWRDYLRQRYGEALSREVFASNQIKTGVRLSNWSLVASTAINQELAFIGEWFPLIIGTPVNNRQAKLTKDVDRLIEDLRFM